MSLLISARRRQRSSVILLVVLLSVGGALGGCNSLPNAGSQPVPGSAKASPQSAAVVDCLLPSRIKKLSGHIAFIAPRRTVRLQAAECEGRGGEFVAQR